MSQSPVMQFFVYAHLPQHLHWTSQPFSALAGRIHDYPEQAIPELEALVGWLESSFPANPETTWARAKLLDAKRMLGTSHVDEVLRKVLEAKDCAVRSLIFKNPD